MSNNNLNLPITQGAPQFVNDIRNALRAVNSNQSGPQSPPTPYSNSFWYEEDTNIFYMRNEVNSAWLPMFRVHQTNGIEILNDTNLVDSAGNVTGKLGSYTQSQWAQGSETIPALIAPSNLAEATTGNILATRTLDLEAPENSVAFYNGSVFRSYAPPVQVTTPPNRGTGTDISTMFSLGNTIYYGPGINRTIYSSIDGAQTWSKVSDIPSSYRNFNYGQNGLLYGINYASNPYIGVVSTNQGRSFSNLSVIRGSDFEYVTATSNGDVYANVELRVIYRSIDGGSNWVQIFTGSFADFPYAIGDTVYFGGTSSSQSSRYKFENTRLFKLVTDQLPQFGGSDGTLYFTNTTDIFRSIDEVNWYNIIAGQSIGSPVILPDNTIFYKDIRSHGGFFKVEQLNSQYPYERGLVVKTSAGWRNLGGRL